MTIKRLAIIKNFLRRKPVIGQATFSVRAPLQNMAMSLASTVHGGRYNNKRGVILGRYCIWRSWLTKLAAVCLHQLVACFRPEYLSPAMFLDSISLKCTVPILFYRGIRYLELWIVRSRYFKFRFCQNIV